LSTNDINISGSLKLENHSDEELLYKYSQGSEEAFRYFFTKRSKLIYAFLLRNLKKKEDAEDCLQTTFLKIHRNIHKYDPCRSAMNWYLTIARRTSIDQLRKRKIEVEFNETIHSNKHKCYFETEDLLDKIMKQLTNEEYNLIKNHYLDGKTYKELATYKQKPAMLRKRASRILEKMRNFI
jgi:RNA polymerase sigma factor (sigma-70 family)